MEKKIFAKGFLLGLSILTICLIIIALINMVLPNVNFPIIITWISIIVFIYYNVEKFKMPKIWTLLGIVSALAIFPFFFGALQIEKSNKKSL